ncbi:hypothetical protein EDC04DRAFT_2610199 [Pisolithus marmoratus]|nr:hypothetical protein EDC04DRAFT_2610199 [Pisolithus marmoratus]
MQRTSGTPLLKLSCLILPKFGKEAISAKQHWVTTQPPFPVRWPSIYLGIDVIVNQETPPHQDQASAPSLLDLVPGTMVFLAGKLLTHSVPKWEKGERIALAHYMKHAIHNRFGLARPIPPRPEGESSPTKKWMLGTSTSHLAMIPPSPEGTQREWLPWRAEYLNVILEGEQLAKAGICEQCEEAEVSSACPALESMLVQRWNGTHYKPTSLTELGFLWHIGHGGDPCPQNSSDPDPDESGYMTGEEPPNHRHSDDLAIRRSSWFQMTIVHTEGIFSHEVSVCNCPGSHPNDWHLGLLRQRLFPASISKPKTAFTFTVLDHFLIDALECKPSAMSFYQKLKRFTNNAFPERDRYRELMRVSQLWRGLKHRKWFGFGHDMEQDPGHGGLALFCPACPQPGWIGILTAFRDTIMRQYIIDGNFTAQHMKMNKPELDVALPDGKGYMVAEVPYQSHLKQSLDSKEIFRKGRGCQWSINFRTRGKNSPSLLLPPALEIVPAVGKFHLAAHKLSCFPRYSLTFIKGAGHLDGEILEILWAPFNKISPTARSMTQAHRQEVYDDHMRDSNWKKLVGMGKFFFSWRGCKFMPNITVPSLLKKYKNSNKCLEEMNEAYEQLTAVLDPDKVARWESNALRADSPLLSGVAWLAEGISIEDSQIEKFHSNAQASCKGLDIDLGAFTPQDDPAFCGSDEEEHEDREFWDDDEGDWEAPEEEVEGLASELMRGKGTQDWTGQ